jgi:hypothetical protein
MADIISSNPPARLEEYIRFHESIGLEIPDDLKKVYEYSDGFLVERTDFEFHGDVYYVDEFYKLAGDDVSSSLVDLHRWWAVEDGILKDCHVPIADAAAGTDVFAYSLCKDDFGSIFFYSMEHFPDPGYVFKMFDSLREFANTIGLAQIAL